MTEEERRIITEYVERVAGANRSPARSASPWGALGGGAAQAAQPPLPPLDPDADRLIGDLFARHPEARYRLTQTAFVQEAALVEMQNRIQQLEWEVENARRQGQAAQQPRGMFGGMFGGGSAARPAPMPPRPQPQYPPNYNPGMMQQGRGGSGFLGTAMMTAAGVAGGMLLGNALMGAFSGGAAEAATTAAGDFGQEAVPTSGGYEETAQNDAAAYGNEGYGNDAGAFEDGGYEEEL